MNDKKLYILWGVLFIVCALLGFIPEPQGLIKALLVLISLAFFVPGGILLYRAVKAENLAAIGRIRMLSLISLGATLVLLVLNFLSVTGTVAAGQFLYSLLVFFSAPMVCSQYWVISLFLWACLLFTSLSFIRRCKKEA